MVWLSCRFDGIHTAQAEPRKRVPQRIDQPPSAHAQHGHLQQLSLVAACT